MDEVIQGKPVGAVLWSEVALTEATKEHDMYGYSTLQICAFLVLWVLVALTS